MNRAEAASGKPLSEELDSAKTDITVVVTLPDASATMTYTFTVSKKS